MIHYRTTRNSSTAPCMHFFLSVFGPMFYRRHSSIGAKTPQGVIGSACCYVSAAAYRGRQVVNGCTHIFASLSHRPKTNSTIDEFIAEYKVLTYRVWEKLPYGVNNISKSSLHKPVSLQRSLPIDCSRQDCVQ